MKLVLLALRIIAIALLVSVMCITLIGLLGGRFNRTGSHPIGLYWIVNQEPQVGLYAQFCIPVSVDDLPPIDQVYVAPCTADSAGHPVIKSIAHIDVERDAYTVQGDHPQSLDSRVFGPIKRADITGILSSVWTTKAVYPDNSY